MPRTHRATFLCMLTAMTLAVAAPLHAADPAPETETAGERGEGRG